jgi:hypothetical protein
VKPGDRVTHANYPERVGSIIGLDASRDLARVLWDDIGYSQHEPLENLTILGQLPKGLADKYCNHDWVRYTGFTQSYRFCTHCDLKELPDDIRRGHYS